MFLSATGSKLTGTHGIHARSAEGDESALFSEIQSLNCELYDPNFLPKEGSARLTWNIIGGVDWTCLYRLVELRLCTFHAMIIRC